MLFNFPVRMNKLAIMRSFYIQIHGIILRILCTGKTNVFLFILKEVTEDE